MTFAAVGDRSQGLPVSANGSAGVATTVVRAAELEGRKREGRLYVQGTAQRLGGSNGIVGRQLGHAPHEIGLRVERVRRQDPAGRLDRGVGGRR